MGVSGLTGGGAPVLGEPLPIEFGNATYAVRGRVKDGLQSTDHLAAWLRDIGSRLPVELSDRDILGVTDGDLAVARELRDAIRTLAAAAVDGGPPDPVAAATLNRLAKQTPRWRELRTRPEPRAEICYAGRAVAAALAGLAEQAVSLFAGQRRHELRACQGPECVLYFIRDDPRREWCSPGCGNRARAARHYAKRRQPT